MLKNSKDSKVIFFDDDEELYTITRIFLQIPWDYGFSGAVGKKYEAIKDFLQWNDFDVKKWTPILLQMGNAWINASAKKE